MVVIKVVQPNDGEPRLAGRLLIEAPYALHERLKEIPGARYYRPRSMWTVPQRWPQMVALGAVAGETRSVVEPDAGTAQWLAAEKAYVERLTRLAEYTTVARDKRSALGLERDLFGHQDVGSAWLSVVRPGDGVLLFDETGAGKTRTVLAAVERLGADAALPVLVVTLNTVKASWQAEAIEYGWDPERIAVIGGTAAQRRKQLTRVAEKEADLAIINWESLRLHTRISAFPGQTIRRCPECGGPKGEKAVTEARCQAHRRELNEIDWGLVCLDEAHRMKNPKAEMTQSAWGVADSLPPITRRVAMTGTPVADTPEDLWPLLRFVDPQGFPVKSVWVERYCRAGFDWFGAWRVEGLKPERREEFDRWWRPINRRVLKAQVLDLPPLLRGGTLTRWVDMAGAQSRAYDEMKNGMVAQIKNGEITAANILTQAGRLMLLASAYGTPGEKDGELQLVRPSCKADQLAEDLAAGDHGGGNKPLVVAMASRRLLRLVESVLADKLHWGPEEVAVIAGDVSTADRQKGIEAFQAGHRRVLLMTFGAGGAGITLTAADTMILLQRSWSAIETKQAMDRVHRIGSERHESVGIVDYITRNSVEIGQIRKVKNKEGVLEEIVRDQDALMALLEGR